MTQAAELTLGVLSVVKARHCWTTQPVQVAAARRRASTQHSAACDPNLRWELNIDVSDSRQGSKRSLFARLGELGPAWISALAALIVALTGAGFFAGRVTGQPAPGPTATITVPASPRASTGASSPPASAVGKDLGSYTIDLAGNYGVPLGPAKPTQSQYSPEGIGDLVKTYSRIGAGGDDQMVLLPDGTTPTYQLCKSTTNFSGQIVPTRGNAFCIIETTGYIVGATVTAVSASLSDVTLTITVWKNST